MPMMGKFEYAKTKVAVDILIILVYGQVLQRQSK